MSEIRKYFISRFNDGGVLLELDFSQLEIYALAFLSCDKQLRSDLLSGQDLHDISAEMLYGPTFSQKQRKIAKQLSFQLQYGAGAKSMADKNGIPLKEAKRFISEYYHRYPGVKLWQDKMIETVKRSRVLTTDGRRTPNMNQVGEGTLKSITNRVYKFYEQDSPDWMKGGGVSFSPTQIKNYPVQGFATGDIVPMILGKLYREVVQEPWRKNILMINTVHDSVLFDCSSEALAKDWRWQAKSIMEKAPMYLKEQFNIDFDLPLKVSAEMGKNWMTMNPLDMRC